MAKQEITKEMVETYRKVRRYYATEDVKCWLEDHGIELDEDDDLFIDLVDDYDQWQGDNIYWWEAIGTLASDMGLEW